MIDTHAHLNDEKLFSNIKTIMQNAKQAGVNEVVCIGYDLPSSKRAVEVANAFENVYEVIAVHPHDAKT